MIATTSSTCRTPPSVVVVIIPRNHNSRQTKTIISSIAFPPPAAMHDGCHIRLAVFLKQRVQRRAESDARRVETIGFAEAKNHRVLKQSREHVAVPKRGRIAEHLPRLHGIEWRNRVVESSDERVRRGSELRHRSPLFLLRHAPFKRPAWGA